ncbi:MAG: alpha/beta fold hydrolase [Balneola sp.]
MEYDNLSISSGQVLTEDDLPIKYDLYSPISGTRKDFPVIIFLHGFKGFKDWGPFPDACEDIARHGFGVLAINFSHNGIGDGRTEYQRLDLFEKSTLSKDLDEVGLVINALQRGEIDDSHSNLNTDSIGIVGHSRGGHTAIAAAAEYESVKCLVTWAAVSDYLSRFSEKEIADWKKEGFTIYKNSRTGQDMKVDKSLYEDIKENAERLVALRRVEDLVIPSLFIHGREDESVPQTNSEELEIACGSKEKELRLIAKAGHTFGASHPFAEEVFPPQFKELVDVTGAWFRQYLR